MVRFPLAMVVTSVLKNLTRPIFSTKGVFQEKLTIRIRLKVSWMANRKRRSFKWRIAHSYCPLTKTWLELSQLLIIITVIMLVKKFKHIIPLYKLYTRSHNKNKLYRHLFKLSLKIRELSQLNRRTKNVMEKQNSLKTVLKMTWKMIWVTI